MINGVHERAEIIRTGLWMCIVVHQRLEIYRAVFAPHSQQHVKYSVTGLMQSNRELKEKEIYFFRSTASPIPSAVREIARGSGDFCVGVAVGQGV